MNFFEMVDVIATSGAVVAEEVDDGQGGMKLKCKPFSAIITDWEKDDVDPTVAYLVDTDRVITNAWNTSLTDEIEPGMRLRLGRMRDGRWVYVAWEC